MLPLLAQLWPNQPLDPEPLKHVFNRALASHSQAYLCAANGERVIGFGSLTVKNNLGHVDELVVDKKYRGQAIGTRLLDHLETPAKQRGCRRLELDSAFHRTEAHEFYERQGFSKRVYLLSKDLKPLALSSCEIRMKPQAIIRRATVDDVAAITEIYNEAIATTTATLILSPKPPLSDWPGMNRTASAIRSWLLYWTAKSSVGRRSPNGLTARRMRIPLKPLFTLNRSIVAGASGGSSREP